MSEVLDHLYRGDAASAERAAAARDLDVFEAAALGRAARVTALLEGDDALATARAADGFTALHLAAFFGHAGVARLLLAAGADANAESANPMRVRPLHSAAARGDHAVMALLLDGGADPDARQAGGYTALQSRALHGDLDGVRMLLARGADPRLAADDGRTALSMAREKGHDAVVAVLEAPPAGR